MSVVFRVGLCVCDRMRWGEVKVDFLPVSLEFVKLHDEHCCYFVGEEVL